MKISIIASTYNGGKYIMQLMDSLHLQTRQADEVLFLDDGSSDTTVFLIQKYIKKNNLSHWKLFVNSQNKGWKRNFMEGIWQAEGDLIFPCDQDDIWEEDKLFKMEQIMEKHPEIDVLTSNCEAFYDSGKVVIRPEPENRELIQLKMSKNIYNIRYPGCTYCIRSSLAKLSKQYWKPDFPHDAIFWWMGMLSGRLYAYNESLIRWRRHEDSTYTIESIQLKTWYKKREWINYAEQVINSLQGFIDSGNCPNVRGAKEILNNNSSWLKCRAEFYDSRNFYTGLKLLKYRKYYDRFKQYIGDWYLIFIKKRAQENL